MPVTVDMAGFTAYLNGEIAAYLGDDLGPRIKDDAVRYAPLGVSTPPTVRWPPHEAGELKASIEHHLDGPRALIVEAHAPYAAYVELGTARHEIKARGPWALRNAVTGQVWWSGHVNHPGTPPEPYLRPALYQERA